jgi:hypothetical protein
MPKRAIDYSKTSIYKIVCKDIEVKDLYVGHTTNFCKRKQEHKCNCINEKNAAHNSYVYQEIRKNGGWYNWDMIEVEKYVCNDEREATARERFWIETLHATLNKIRPNRTKEEIKIYRKNHYEQHKEEIKEQNKQNKEEKFHYNLQYRNDNKEKIKAYKKEKITCECGCIVCRAQLTEHKKTKRHFDLMSEKQQDDTDKNFEI